MQVIMERFQHISRIADLIVAELTGRISDAERDELERWKNECPENLSLYGQYVSQSFIEGKCRFAKEYNVEDAFRDFKRKADFARQRKRRLVFYRYAGVLALLMILGGSLFLFKGKHHEPAGTVVSQIQPGGLKAILTRPDGTKVDISDTTYLAFVGQVSDAGGERVRRDTTVATSFHTITIPRGGEYALTLSDGSSLWMNSESELRVPEHFDVGLREVYMTGEIYFEIVRDAKAPFVVHTRQGEIKVLGTSFNVRDYADEKFLETTLVSGKVAFEQEGQDTYLSPGEQLRLNKESGEATVEKVDARLFCSWKDGRFVFEKQRLEEIMNTISRWYDIHVFYESQAMKDILFTGNIKRYGDLDQVIEMMRLINKIEIEINGNNVFIKSNQ